MKLVAFVPPGAPIADGQLGVLDGSSILPLPGTGPDVATLIGSDLPELQPAPAIPAADARLLAPLPRPGKIICIGLNYRDHCREQGIDPPEYPMLFAKFANAISHPGEPVTRPRATEKLDLECELGVVVGRRLTRVSREDALDGIFAYTIVNDVTMRDLQREDRQWLRAKGSDGFAPIGPAVVTADELGSAAALRMRSAVNGETWQDSTTAEMVFDVPTAVAFISRTITLEPGDIIATGTPAGVGHFQVPPRYLKDGDVMRCEIEGIGALENPVADELPRSDDHATASGVAGLLSGEAVS